MSDVTQILSEIETGDPVAADRLLPLVYEKLHKLAAAKLANEQPGQALQATALVHEAYLRLVKDNGDVAGGAAQRRRPTAGRVSSHCQTPLGLRPSLSLRRTG